jgi:hypothetical protein
VCDALSPFGIGHLNPPFTPERVWAAMERSRSGSGSGSG